MYNLLFYQCKVQVQFGHPVGSFLGSSFFQKRTEEFSEFTDNKRQQTTVLITRALTVHDMKFLWQWYRLQYRLNVVIICLRYLSVSPSLRWRNQFLLVCKRHTCHIIHMYGTFYIIFEIMFTALGYFGEVLDLRNCRCKSHYIILTEPCLHCVV